MINNILLGVFDEDMLYVTTTITPITEEIVKALPILFLRRNIADKDRMSRPAKGAAA